VQDDREAVSKAYLGPDTAPGPFDGVLPPAPSDCEYMSVSIDNWDALRRLASRYAESAGMGVDRVLDLSLAVSELAANSIRYGGGCGEFRMWRDNGALVCEVT